MGTQSINNRLDATIQLQHFAYELLISCSSSIVTIFLIIPFLLLYPLYVCTGTLLLRCTVTEMVKSTDNLTGKVNSTSTSDSHRIISLLPSITEVVSVLGFADQIVGITHECDFPAEAVKNALVVTSTELSPYSMTQDEIHQAVCGSLLQGNSLYGLDAEKLRKLKPTVIFTQSLCDICAVSYPMVLATCARLLSQESEKEGKNPSASASLIPAPMSCSDPAVCRPADDPENIALLAQPGMPNVISMEPNNLEDILTTFHVAGRALGVPEKAVSVVHGIRENLNVIESIVKHHCQQHNISTRPHVAFLEWHQPLFTGGHWIADMLDIVGVDYRMCKSGDRSAAIENQRLIDLDPDYILIGPCGFHVDRSERDTIELLYPQAWFRELRAVREGRVICLDGNAYYSRPGPRLVQGTALMAAAVYGPPMEKALGEELAPVSTGLQRLTPERIRVGLATFALKGGMVGNDKPDDKLETPKKLPALTETVLLPLSFFVAWDGVLVLSYTGFSSSLLEAKRRLDSTANHQTTLKPEGFGSKWPKTTLGAVRDDAPPLTVEELERLLELCKTNSSVLSDLRVPLKKLSVVHYQCRSLEQLIQRDDIELAEASTTQEVPVSAEQRERVQSVLSEAANVTEYVKRVNPSRENAFSNISSYRNPVEGCTCIAFLSKNHQLLATLRSFRHEVDQSFPGRYEWMEEESLHCTLRSID